MPTTRSSTKQSKLDDFEVSQRPKNTTSKANTQTPQKSKNKSAQKTGEATGNSLKRTAAVNTTSEAPPAKQRKKTAANSRQQHFTSDSITDFEKPIIINRSPVLQLWGACVANFLDPELTWKACLSIGNTISSLCAVSKGRSIGKIEPPDEAKTEERKGRKKAAQTEARSVEIMGFPVFLKDDAALVSGKPKLLDEDNLIGKFGGEEQYQRTKSTMSDALASWEKNKDELDKKAFHMYEKFRPNVATGQQGWGRKGELNLHHVSSIVKQ